MSRPDYFTRIANGTALEGLTAADLVYQRG